MTEAEAQAKARKRIWPIVATISIIAGLALVYVGISVYFLYHYGFNTEIDGVDVSLGSPEQAQEIIEEKVSGYSLQIEARENTPIILTGKQINLRLNSDSQNLEILEEQFFLAWPLRLFFEQPGYQIDYSLSFDQNKLTDISSNWPFFDETKMKAPTDAHVEFQAPEYVVVPEYNGTKLVKEQALNAIAGAIEALESDIRLEDANCYTKPQIVSTSTELAEQVALYNRYVPFSITYQFGEQIDVLDGRTAINWVDTSAEPTGELNYEAVAAWVADYAERHDTVGKPRQIINGFGETKEVTGEVDWEIFYGGPYGWQIDQAAEIEAIMAAAINHTGEVREPYFLQRAASFGPQDWGDTYLEVDINAQHMWYYKDGQLVVDCDVVTGQPVYERDTPTGVFFLIEKSSPKRMKGEGWPGVEPWDETVNYYMGFTWEGHGFHDGLWRNAFGGNIWRTNGSHGCINMPLEPTRKLFETVEYGTPVISHM